MTVAKLSDDLDWKKYKINVFASGPVDLSVGLYDLLTGSWSIPNPEPFQCDTIFDK